MVRSNDPTSFFRCPPVSLGLATRFSCSEATSIGLSGLASQRIRSLDQTMCVS